MYIIHVNDKVYIYKGRFLYRGVIKAVTKYIKSVSGGRANAKWRGMVYRGFLLRVWVEKGNKDQS